MYDDVMYAWQVVSDYDETVLFTCMRMEVANYYRDWCEAVESNIWRDVASHCMREYNPNSGHECKFSVVECEVYL